MNGMLLSCSLFGSILAALVFLSRTEWHLSATVDFVGAVTSGTLTAQRIATATDADTVATVNWGVECFDSSSTVYKTYQTLPPRFGHLLWCTPLQSAEQRQVHMLNL